jgi:hypothetical protein
LPHKPLVLAAVVILAGCGGEGGGSTQVVAGDGFRFEAPTSWHVERKTGSVGAMHGHVDLVSVQTFRLVRRYTPKLFAAATNELDGRAAQLAGQLNGTLATSETVRVADADARSYRIEFDGKVEEITFVLRDKREYQLLCRRDADAGRDACKRLVRSFELA